MLTWIDELSQYPGEKPLGGCSMLRFDQAL